MVTISWPDDGGRSRLTAAALGVGPAAQRHRGLLSTGAATRGHPRPANPVTAGPGIYLLPCPMHRGPRSIDHHPWVIDHRPWTMHRLKAANPNGVGCRPCSPNSVLEWAVHRSPKRIPGLPRITLITIATPRKPVDGMSVSTLNVNAEWRDVSNGLISGIYQDMSMSAIRPSCILRPIWQDDLMLALSQSLTGNDLGIPEL
jgi:hypothetical protein